MEPNEEVSIYTFINDIFKVTFMSTGELKSSLPLSMTVNQLIKIQLTITSIIIAYLLKIDFLIHPLINAFISILDSRVTCCLLMGTISQNQEVRDIGLLYFNTLHFSKTVSQILYRSHVRTSVILRNLTFISMCRKLCIAYDCPFSNFIRSRCG